MNFFVAFWDVLRSQPSRALAALYWHVTGRKVRARNRLRVGLAKSLDVYKHWVALVERGNVTAADAETTMAAWPYRPVFSILVHQGADLDQIALKTLMQALHAQWYPRWELIIVPSPEGPPLAPDHAERICIAGPASADGGEALRIASLCASGDHLLPLPRGAALPPTALFRYAEALQPEPMADLLFGDHDEVDRFGIRHRPWFKPQWNAELALAQDYLSQAAVVSARAARRALDEVPTGDRAAPYALALAIASRDDAVVRHVGHIQAHLDAATALSSTAERTAVVRHHLRQGGVEDVHVSEGAHGTVRVDWPLPIPRPLVSIIIPTRDKIELLRACLGGLFSLTTYRPFEILIIDNGSVRADSLAYLDECARRDDVSVIRDSRPYNFSQLNNLAVASARGDYLCLLNNDTEVIDGDWLTAMMRQAVRPQVGAVGARLLYDDGSIQHAGVTIGLGEAAGHSHRFQKPDALGYFARAATAHYVSAVTAACLVVEKRKFLAVGGLDEEGFAIAFNDVDLCLKLQRAGWRNLYTPHATLLHHESKSRGKDFSPRHIERYMRELHTLQDRWGTRDYADPLHHPRLDRSQEEYLLRLEDL